MNTLIRLIELSSAILAPIALIAEAQPAPISSWSLDKQEKKAYRRVGKGTCTYAGAVVEPGAATGKVTTVADEKKAGAASFIEQPPGFIRIPIDLPPSPAWATPT